MNNSIGLKEVAGAEYRVNDGEWQDSSIFDRLTPDTTYTFYQRLKASADSNYLASAETSVIATTQSVGASTITIPFDQKFVSKPYDETGVFDELSSGSYMINLGGATNVKVDVSAFLSSDLGPSAEPQEFDEANAVRNPATAGPYVIRYELPRGYSWADNGSSIMEAGFWIYPKFGSVYINDTLSDVTMEGCTPDADSTAANLKLSFALTDGAAFDTSRTGMAQVPVSVTANGSTVQTNFPIEVLPWVITDKSVPSVKLANDDIFSSDLLPSTVSVTAKARDKEQVFNVPVAWDVSQYDDSRDANTIPGTLDFSGVSELEGNTDTRASVVVTRLAALVAVPFESKFTDKTYDGVEIFADGKDYSVTVGKAEIPVQVTAYVESVSGQAEADPTAAGKYVICAELPDGYYWEGTASQTMDTTLWIYPAVSPIYVGDSLDNVTLTTGMGAYTFESTASPSFSTSMSGETTMSITATGPVSVETIDLPVTVLPWNVTEKENVQVTGKYGTAFDALGAPISILVTAQGSGEPKEFRVHVTWASDSYDAYADSQTITGTLDVAGIPELAGMTDLSVSMDIRLALNDVTAPAIADFSKTYDGISAPIPVPELPAGIENCSVSYSGTSFAGVAYGPSADAPVNAGTYTATVSFTMAPGYAQAAPVEVDYTINKAPQAAPGSISTVVVSYDSIVLRPVDGAEYSNDNVNWQSSNSFYGLAANTQYTMYVRMPATADGNYEASEPVSMSVTTSQKDAQPPTLTPRTVTYTGDPQAYEVDRITGVQEAVVSYLFNGEVLSGVPTDAGSYDVSITYNMEPGYKQLEPMTSKLTILKAPQTAPVATVTAASDTSLTISNLSGAEYSINGGSTWQTSHIL